MIQTIGFIGSESSGSTTFTASSSGTLTSVTVRETSNNSTSTVKGYINFNGYSTNNKEYTKSSSGKNLETYTTPTSLSAGESFKVTVYNTSRSASFDNVTVSFEFSGSGGGGGSTPTVYLFQCSNPSYFTCPSSVEPGDGITISWGQVTVYAGTLAGFKLIETTTGIQSPLLSPNTRSYTLYTGSSDAGKTFRFTINIIGLNTDGNTRELTSSSYASCDVINITPVHIKQAGSITSVSRTSGGIFGNLNGYYLNASNTSNVVLNWSAASGNNTYATPRYIIQKNNVDIITVGTNRSYSIPITHMPGVGEMATFRIKCYSTADTSPTISGYFFTTPITIYGVGFDSNVLNVNATNTFTTINNVICNIPIINISANAPIANITRQYTTQYKLKTSSTYTTFTPTTSTTIGATQNFVFTPPSSLPSNTQVDFKITCTLMYGATSMGITANGVTTTSSVYGTPPNQINSLIFSIDESSYYGTPFNHIYTVSNNSWNTEELFKFGANTKIKLRINLGAVVDANAYNRVAEITWKRGNNSIGNITCISSTLDYIEVFLVNSGGENLTQFIYNGTALEINCPELFNTLVSAPITFMVMAKSQLKSDINVFLSNNSYALNSNNHFSLVGPPNVYTNGTTIPTITPTNGILNVNFTTRDEPTNGNDFKLINIQGMSVDGIDLYGYKVWIEINGIRHLIEESILSETKNESSFDINNYIFIPSEFVPYGTTINNDKNIVSLELDILSNPIYLRTLINNGNDLSLLDEIKTLKYIIKVVDILQQESEDSLYLEAKYDFRVPSEMVIPPIINFSNYDINNTYTPLIRNITYYGASYIEEALCFHGQAFNDVGDSISQKDWIVFEWYPAFKQSNENDYYTINGIKYLKAECTDSHSYYLYKWNYGNTGLVTNTFSSKKLTSNDFYSIIETITIGEETYNVTKYIGRYAINLKKLQEDELSYMSIIPAYGSGEETKYSHAVFPSNGGENSNPYNNKIMYNGRVAPIYIARFTYPNTLITGIDRTSTGDDKKISFKVNDYGTSKKLNSININENNFSEYGPLTRLKIEAKLLFQGTPVEYSSSNYILVKDSNEIIGENNPLLYYQYASEFGLEIYGSALKDKDAYIANLTTYIECKRSNVIFNGTTYILEGITESISSTIEQYIAPAFGTLSLRKNKIGINKSALTRVEETLSIVGKDRCDKITDIANPNSFASSYKNIVGIYASDFSKMPQYNNDSIDLPISQNNLRGSYIGFYGTTQENEPWVGSIGFEEDGNGYIVTSEIINGERIYKKTKIGDSYIIGSGLVVTDGILKHSNIVEPKMQQTVYPITFDSEGHITSAGEPFSVPSGYILDFDATDWTNLTITIPESIHNCGADPCVDVYYLEEGFYKKAWGIYTSIDWNIVINTDGDISLKTLTPFAGKIVIK